MSERPRSDRRAQNRVVALFTDSAQPDCLGYRYLGDWHQHPEEGMPILGMEAAVLRENLAARGYSAAHTATAIHKLKSAAALSDIDGELTALEARLHKTRDLKQAMMQELLTGRTRLI